MKKTGLHTGLGIDYGTKNIGTALLFIVPELITPLKKIDNSSVPFLQRELENIMRNYSVDFLVIGIPSHQNMAKKVTTFIAQLQLPITLPLYGIKEDLTTVEGRNMLSSLRQAGSKIKTSNARDSISASLILEEWLTYYKEKKMAYYNSTNLPLPKPNKRNTIFVFIIVSITLFALALFFITQDKNSIVSKNIAKYSCYWDTSVATQLKGDSKEVSFTIESGEMIDSIAKRLTDQGLIQDTDYFICTARKNKAVFHAGRFLLKFPMSMEQLLENFKDTAPLSNRVIIREGLRGDEIGKLLEQTFTTSFTNSKFKLEEFSTLMTDTEFIEAQGISHASNLEGLLFPDTYEFSEQATAESVITVLLTTYKKKVLTPLNNLEDSYLSPSQVRILASLIEKEATGSVEEKQMIADIIIRRLKAGWFLNIDASSLYEKGDWKYPLTSTDLKIDSPYNTYMRKGLPPTPICNPGYNSYFAALNPEPNDYWYYLHDTSGTIRYAKTLSEHQSNINKYLR